MPPAHIVISEFRPLGPGGASDEFIELFNPSAASVNVGNWQIKKFSCSGTTPSTLLTIPANTILLAGQHYLVVNTGATIGSADQTYSSPLAPDNGIAILASNGDIVDQVGVCSSPADNDYYLEGDGLDKLADYPQEETESYQRKVGGCVDTDDNADDFAILTPPNPQNRASAATICVGAVTPTPSRTPTPTRTTTPTKTRAPTPVPTAVPVEIVINEFLPHPRTDWNADGKANFGDEYIEIINISSKSVSLSGWKLDDDVDGSPAYPLPKVTLLPRQIIHFYASETGISLSDGGDTVRLINPGGVTIDAYTYPVVLSVDVTWCRLPDGTGTWGFVCHPSPGNPNTRLEPGQPSSAGYLPDGGASICLGDNVPAGILQAECSSGAGVWEWGLWGDETEAWLGGLTKWLIVFK